MDGTEVWYAAHMQPQPGGAGFQFCITGVGIYEGERLSIACAVVPFPGKGVQVPASPMGHRNVCLVGTLPLQQPLGKYLSGDNTKYSRDQLT